MDAKDEMIATYIDVLRSRLDQTLMSIARSQASITEKERSDFLLSLVDDALGFDGKVFREYLYAPPLSPDGHTKLTESIAKRLASTHTREREGERERGREKNSGRESQNTTVSQKAKSERKVRDAMLPRVATVVFSEGSPYVSMWIEAEKRSFTSKMRAEGSGERYWDTWDTHDTYSGRAIQIYQNAIRIVAHLSAALRKSAQIPHLPHLYSYQSTIFASVAENYLQHLKSQSDDVMRWLRRTFTQRSDPNVLESVCVLLNSSQFVLSEFDKWEGDDSVCASPSMLTASSSSSSSPSSMAIPSEISCSFLKSKFEGFLSQSLADVVAMVASEVEGTIRLYFLLSWSFLECDLSIPDATPSFLEVIQFFHRNLSFLREHLDHAVFIRLCHGVTERVDEFIFQRIKEQKGKISELGAKQMGFDFNLMYQTFRSFSSQNVKFEFKKIVDAITILSLSNADFQSLGMNLRQSIAEQQNSDEKKRIELVNGMKMRLRREYSVYYLDPNPVLNVIQSRLL